MRVNLLPDSIKGDSGIEIPAIHDLGNIRENQWFSMNELVQNVFLQSLVIIVDSVGLSQLEGVAAVRQDHRHNLVLVVQQVAAMDVCDGNLVLDPSTKT